MLLKKNIQIISNSILMTVPVVLSVPIGLGAFGFTVSNWETILWGFSNYPQRALFFQQHQIDYVDFVTRILMLFCYLPPYVWIKDAIRLWTDWLACTLHANSSLVCMRQLPSSVHRLVQQKRSCSGWRYYVEKSSANVFLWLHGRMFRLIKLFLEHESNT